MRKLTLKVTTRNDGRVCKRIGGALRIWPDKESARKEILALIGNREANPHAATVAAAPRQDQAASVRLAFNGFLQDREKRLVDRRLKEGTFLDYKEALDSFVSGLGTWRPEMPDPVSVFRRDVPVAALQPAHFRHVRTHQSRGIGAFALERRIQGVRTAFRWAWEIGRLITTPPYYGDEYHKPSSAEKRAAKRKTASRGGEPRFNVDELRAILSSQLLKPALNAMVWLALNGGLYSADCAILRWSDLKKEGRHTVIDMHRQKTGIHQKFVLWPETIKALEVWKPLRPAPKEKTDSDRVFVTYHGNPWLTERLTRDESGLVKGGGETDSIRLLFNRLLRELKIKRHGVGFGKLRHTHISAAASHPDINARKVVRGHKIDGIEEHYDYQGLDRLKSVTDLIYKNLVTPATKNRKTRA